MAWNTNARTDLAADDSLPTGIGSWLVAQERLCAEIPIAVEFTDQTTTNATYETLTSFTFQTPDYGAGTFYLYLWPDAYVSSGTQQFRIRTNANNGTEVDVTQAASHADTTAGSKVLLSAANTVTTIFVEGHTDGVETLHVQMVDRITAWVAGA